MHYPAPITVQLWSLLNLLFLLSMAFFGIRFIFRAFFTNKNKTGGKSLNTLAFIPLYMSILFCASSCSKTSDEVVPHQTLQLTQNAAQAPVGTLHFDSKEAADAFIAQVLATLAAPTEEKMALTEQLYVSSLDENARLQYSEYANQGGLARKAPLQTWIPGVGSDFGPGQTGSGGHFSVPYAPFNNVSFSVQYDAANVTNVASYLSGFTYGLNWNQIGFIPTGYHNGQYTFRVDYSVSYSVFVQGFGTYYTTAPATVEVSFNPKTAQYTILW